MTFSLLVAATLVGALLVGFIPALVDGAKAPLQARMNLPDGRVEWFVRLFYFAWLPGMPIAGWMLDTWHNKEIFFFGLFALILGAAWLGLARSTPSLLLNGVFLGLAYSCVTTATIRFMPFVFFPDYIDRNQLNFAALNLGFVMVGLGAMLGPWIVRMLERLGGFRQGLLYLSCVLIAPAALAALCERDLFPSPPEHAASWEEAFTHIPMWLLVGVILLYFAIENCLEFWPDSYLQELGYRERSLNASLAVFWIAFIASRGVAAWWFYEYPGHALPATIALVILAAMMLGNLTAGFDFGGGVPIFWLLGACFGPLLPGFLGLASEILPKQLPGSILGAMLALSGFDTLVVRPIMTAFGKNRPARSVMRAPTFLAALLAVALSLLAFLRN